MDARNDALERQKLLGGEAELLLDAWRAQDPIRGDVPLECAERRGLHGEPQPLLTPRQRFGRRGPGIYLAR